MTQTTQTIVLKKDTYYKQEQTNHGRTTKKKRSRKRVKHIQNPYTIGTKIKKSSTTTKKQDQIHRNANYGT